MQTPPESTTTRGTPAVDAAQAPDPYLWLEDVAGARALDWVAAQNHRSTALITRDPAFEPLREQIRAILDSRDRIPYVRRMGDF